MVDDHRFRGAVHAELFGRGGVHGRHQVILCKVDLLNDVYRQLGSHDLGDPVHAARGGDDDISERLLNGERAPQGVRVGITVQEDDLASGSP